LSATGNELVSVLSLMYQQWWQQYSVWQEAGLG